MVLRKEGLDDFSARVVGVTTVYQGGPTGFSRSTEQGIELSYLARRDLLGQGLYGDSGHALDQPAQVSAAVSVPHQLV